jgi:ABC-type glycerol-3-phosphate transport system substrate-binding protein
MLALILTVIFTVAACGGGGGTAAPSTGGGGGGAASASTGTGGEASPAESGGEASPAGSAEGSEAPATGGSITVTSLWGGAEEEAFQEVLDAFEAKTGITANYEGVRQDYATALQTRITGGNPPDVAIIPGIGFLRRFARDGSIKTLSEIGVQPNPENYAPGILEVGQVDGEQYAVMVKFNSKSTMWYRPDVFSELGVEPAEDWDGFKALIDEIKAGGETPLGLGVSPDDWTLTDWFESIYVRQAGPEAYDRLFSPEGNWTDQTVKDAITEMQAVLSEDNVAGGISGALGTGFVDGIGQVFSENPQAVMYYEGGFVGGIATGQVNENLEIGETIDWFPFPAINGNDAVTIGGDVIAALTTNPGVKEFMEFMTTAESGTVWAETGAVISPLRDVDASVYPNELVQKEAEQVANASAVRFDGSDLLPAGGPNLGALLQQAIQGQDMNGALEQFQSEVQTAWENE